MKRADRSLTGFVAVLLLAAAACGPKVKLSPDFERAKLHTVALLPVVADPDIRKERVAYLRGSVESELRRRGFDLLDNKLVERICSTPQCPERGSLAEDYAVQGFAKLTLESNVSNSFLIGYVNSVQGTLVFENVEELPLATVRHTQTESGGIIFNSGQVFQGIKEGVQNIGDDGFNRLADKFAKTLVAQLPRTVGEGSARATAATDAAIGGVEVKSLRPLVYQVCVNAKPNMVASILIQRQRTTLRDVGAGRYCGIYRINQSIASAKGLAVEVRSPFGEAARKEVQLADSSPCNLDGAVKWIDDGGYRRFNVACVNVAGKSGADSGSCGEELRSCRAAKLLVYRSPQIQGPFEKVAEIHDHTWVDRSKRSTETAIYQVVAVTEQGISSLPITPVQAESAVVTGGKES